MIYFLFFYAIRALIPFIRSVRQKKIWKESFIKNLSMFLFILGHSLLWLPHDLANILILRKEPENSKVSSAKLRLLWSKHLAVFSIGTSVFFVVLFFCVYTYRSFEHVGLLLILLEIGLLSYGLSHVIGGQEIIDKMKSSDNNIYFYFFVFTIFFGINFILVVSFNDLYFFNTIDFFNASSFFSFSKHVVNYSFNDVLGLIADGNFLLSDYIRVCIGALFGLITILDFSFIARLKRNDEHRLELAYNNFLMGNLDRSNYWIKKTKNPAETKEYTKNYNFVNAYLNFNKDLSKSLPFVNNTLSFNDIRGLETTYVKLYKIVESLGNETDKLNAKELLIQNFPDSIYNIIFEFSDLQSEDYQLKFKRLLLELKSRILQIKNTNRLEFSKIFLNNAEFIYAIDSILHYQVLAMKRYAPSQTADILKQQNNLKLSYRDMMAKIKSMNDYDRLTKNEKKQLKTDWINFKSLISSDFLVFTTDLNLISPLDLKILKRQYSSLKQYFAMINKGDLLTHLLNQEPNEYTKNQLDNISIKFQNLTI